MCGVIAEVAQYELDAGGVAGVAGEFFRDGWGRAFYIPLIPQSGMNGAPERCGFDGYGLGV